ncbi:MAG: hypothetical protein US52_C0049G0002 [candidate division WS6 bacterium GW2011_GWA2_37_6]|uniref:Uncharacterized protein n=1 Tax=candidate division WS6 bacterium GW2011_GWA2_37_6 TaxID=1619087 RepID=A0A0G0JD63_9BACT|nr:MAG: hypothetical protein US52_C0049G0002 [candidate division WS6 bacterium GW2011_GWA2_37_6]
MVWNDDSAIIISGYKSYTVHYLKEDREVALPKNTTELETIPGKKILTIEETEHNEFSVHIIEVKDLKTLYSKDLPQVRGCKVDTLEEFVLSEDFNKIAIEFVCDDYPRYAIISLGEYDLQMFDLHKEFTPQITDSFDLNFLGNDALLFGTSIDRGKDRRFLTYLLDLKSWNTKKVIDETISLKNLNDIYDYPYCEEATWQCTSYFAAEDYGRRLLKEYIKKYGDVVGYGSRLKNKNIPDNTYADKYGNVRETGSDRLLLKRRDGKQECYNKADHELVVFLDALYIEGGGVGLPDSRCICPDCTHNWIDNDHLLVSGYIIEFSTGKSAKYKYGYRTTVNLVE